MRCTMVLLALLTLTGSAAQAQDSISHDRLSRVFDELVAANKKSIPAANYVQSRDLAGKPDRNKPTAKFGTFSVTNPSSVPNAPPLSLGVKIWGKTMDTNQFVNLKQHRWKPRDKFQIWLNSAAPIRLAVFYRTPSGVQQMVIPNEKPESEIVIEPAKDVLFPLGIELDDNREDEVMTLVVIHAGAPDLNKKGFDGTAQPVSNGEATEVLRKLIRPVDEKKFGATSKDFGVEYVSTENPNTDVANSPGPVQLQILGSSSIAQYEIVLKKQKGP